MAEWFERLAASPGATDLVAFDAADALAFGVAPDAEPAEDASTVRISIENLFSCEWKFTIPRSGGAGQRRIGDNWRDDGAGRRRHPDIRPLCVPGMQR